MARLSEKDRDLLLKNPNVLKVTGSNVTYTAAFKSQAVKLFQRGLSASEIFSNAGIDTTNFGPKYDSKSLARWEKTFATYGENGFKKERRGSGSKGRPRGNKFKSVEEEIAYLRAENDFLKKIRALEEEEYLASQKDLRSSTRRAPKTKNSK